MKNKTTDILAVNRVLELGTRCLEPEEFTILEKAVQQIKESVNSSTRDEPPTALTKTDWEISETREMLADAYVKLSGKHDHASDCATSCAPAQCPKMCDCDYNHKL